MNRSSLKSTPSYVGQWPAATQKNETARAGEVVNTSSSRSPSHVQIGSVTSLNVNEIIKSLERDRPDLRSVGFTLSAELSPADLERFLQVLAGHREIEHLVINERLTLSGPGLRLWPQDEPGTAAGTAPQHEHVAQFIGLLAQAAFEAQDHKTLKLVSAIQPDHVLPLEVRPTIDQARMLSTCGVGYSLKVPAGIDELSKLMVLMDDASTCPSQVCFVVPQGASHLISAQLYYVMSLDCAVTDFVIEGANRLPKVSSPLSRDRLSARDRLDSLTLVFDPDIKGSGASADLVGHLAPTALTVARCMGAQFGEFVKALEVNPNVSAIKRIAVVAYDQDPSAGSYSAVVETLLQSPYAIEQLSLFTPSMPMSVEEMSLLRERMKRMALDDGVLEQVSLDGRWKLQNALRDAWPLFHFDAQSPLLLSDRVEQIRLRREAWEAMTPYEQMVELVASTRRGRLH